jgi:hypothetical protein
MSVESIVNHVNSHGVTCLSQSGVRMNDAAEYKCACGTVFTSIVGVFKRIHGCEACRKKAIREYQRLSIREGSAIYARVPKEKRVPRFIADLGVYAHTLRRMVAMRAVKLGIEAPVVDSDFVKAIFERIGPKPTGGTFQYQLEFADATAEPMPDNFRWQRHISKAQLDKVSVLTPGLSTQTVQQRVYTLSNGELERAMTSGVTRKRAKNRDYSHDVGREFGDFVVTVVGYKERYTGVVYSIYNLKCKRCGAMKTVYATLIHKGLLTQCKHCGLPYLNRGRNSAYCASNPYGHFGVRWKCVENPGIETRLLMANFLGEFTVFFGQPSYMEARIDAKLLGKEV